VEVKNGGPRQVVASASLILSSKSKSSSKSEGDLERVVFSDWFESDPTRPGASRVEVASKTDIFSICRARSGSNRSSRLSINSSRSLLGVDEEASSSLELARWLLKPPKPLARQI
jgi:hypothetical protein